MATAAQLKELRRKHGLGEFRKKGGASAKKRKGARRVASQRSGLGGMGL